MIWTRLPIAVLLFYLGYRFIQKKKPTRKKLWLALLGFLVIALVVVSEIFPPENQFVTFSAPEDTVQYRSGEKRDYLLRVDGQETALLFYREKDNTLAIEAAKKCEDGWKISNNLVSFAVGIIDMGENNGLMTTFIFQNDDVYLQLTAAGETEAIISDNRSSEFQRLDDTQIAYIGMVEDYVLTVNGKRYVPTLTKEFVGYAVTWTEME